MIMLTREEAQQPLALQLADVFEIEGDYRTAAELRRLHEENETLRAKLSEPEPEPVAYQCCEHGDTEWLVVSADAYCINPSRYKYRALYTTPPQCEWQGLTDEEMRQATQAMNAEPLAEGWRELIKYAHAIEAKLKEKNNG